MRTQVCIPDTNIVNVFCFVELSGTLGEWAVQCRGGGLWPGRENS